MQAKSHDNRIFNNLQKREIILTEIVRSRVNTDARLIANFGRDEGAGLLNDRQFIRHFSKIPIADYWLRFLNFAEATRGTMYTHIYGMLCFKLRYNTIPRRVHARTTRYQKLIGHF